MGGLLLLPVLPTISFPPPFAPPSEPLVDPPARGFNITPAERVGMDLVMLLLVMIIVVG